MLACKRNVWLNVSRNGVSGHIQSYNDPDKEQSRAL